MAVPGTPCWSAACARVDAATTRWMSPIQTVLTEANANNIARWEFTDPDLGYSFSQATIVKVADSTGTGSPRGKWVAIFGNGYNNTGTGHAVLFVVDIETGALIKENRHSDQRRRRQCGHPERPGHTCSRGHQRR